MPTVTITIRNEDRISNTTFHRRCSSDGQRHWWLRRQDGDFVALPERVRGDRAIEVTLDLEPGTYILGAGPAGGHGVRQTIVVEAGQ